MAARADTADAGTSSSTSSSCGRSIVGTHHHHHASSCLLSYRESRRRRDHAALIYNLWTAHGADPAGLAAPFFDGRSFLVGQYVMGLPLDEQDDDDDKKDDDDNDTEDDSPLCRLQQTALTTCHHEASDTTTTPTMPTTTPTPTPTTPWPREIPRVSRDNLTYREFVDGYMQPNLPVVITGLTEDWPAAREWVHHNHMNPSCDGQPNVDALAEHFGHDVAPVYRQTTAGLGIARPTSHEQWTVREYVAWWKQEQQQQEEARAALSEQEEKQTEQQQQEQEQEQQQETTLYYFKDWKFVAAHPDYHAYTCPLYFRDDWLNGTLGNAYKFVYLGLPGTSTILHADVLNSYSWSANVCGTKEWWLIPPSCTYLLYDAFGRTLAPHLDAPAELFPGLARAKQAAYRVRQSAGETIFVPSRWYHTVENIAPTLSINHNWINGYNIWYSFEKLRDEVQVLRGCAGDVVADDDDVHQETTDNSQVADDVKTMRLMLQTCFTDSQKTAEDRAVALRIQKEMNALGL